MKYEIINSLIDFQSLLPINKRREFSYMPKLPNYLFRGDSDPYNSRNLKSTLHNGLLMTNLCNGGTGNEIFVNPLKDSIVRHVDFGWPKTHFLSFSEDIGCALKYGTSSNHYVEVYDFDEEWDFAIHTINTHNFLNITEVDNGLFKASFIPMFNEFQPRFPLLIINVVEHLKKLSEKGKTDLDGAIANAEEDSEWLILPSYPFGSKELSAKLDMNCFEHPSNLYKNL